MPTARRVALVVGAGALVVIAAIAIALRGDEPPARHAALDAGRPDAAATAPSREPPSDARAVPSVPAAVPAADLEKARRLVETARSEASAGRYNEALALLMQAYELDGSPATLLEIAALDHRTGRCREARAAALRVVAASPGPDLQQRAQALLADIGRCD